MDNFFLQDEHQANPGMYLHENTKNFRVGSQFYQTAGHDVQAATQWIYDIYTDDKILDVVKLPDIEQRDLKTLNCLDTFLTRRSTRKYADKPLELNELSQFLKLAYPISQTQENIKQDKLPHQSLSKWNGHVTCCRLILLIKNVTGIEPGAYVYDEFSHSLNKIKAQSNQEMDAFLKEYCFQAEFIESPVMLLQVGSIKTSTERYGERGYRYMLFEDGVQIQRMYLSGSANGLACCATGSLVQGKVEGWLGLDGFNGSILNGFVIGHYCPTPESQNEQP